MAARFPSADGHNDEIGFGDSSALTNFEADVNSCALWIRPDSVTSNGPNWGGNRQGANQNFQGPLGSAGDTS